MDSCNFNKRLRTQFNRHDANKKSILKINNFIDEKAKYIMLYLENTPEQGKTTDIDIISFNKKNDGSLVIISARRRWENEVKISGVDRTYKFADGKLPKITHETGEISSAYVQERVEKYLKDRDVCFTKKQQNKNILTYYVNY